MRDYDREIPDLRPEGDSELRNCQLVMLRILKIFDRICSDSGLRYWISSGTLLGAVRYAGFIPWDDDVDVMMPLEDYRRFLELAPSLLPYDLFLQTRQSDPAHPVAWAKLRDRFSFMDDPGGPFAYSQGIPIDIFPATYMTRRRHLGRKFFALAPPYRMRPEWPRKGWSAKHKLYSGTFALLQCAARPLLCGGPVSRAFARWGDRGDKFWVNDYPQEWLNEAFPDEAVFPLSRIYFEHFVFSCPADPCRCLEIQYGPDYMTPPPEGERGAHSVRSYLITGPNLHSSALRWQDYREKKATAAAARP
jgi:lipopolysaccharide cholinephosphotransferase